MITTLMRLFTLISAACLTACATVQDDAASIADPIDMAVQSGKSLPSQTLRPGECGLFGWDAAGETDFVFFATADRALYADGDTVRRLPTHGSFPASIYGPLLLDLGPSETLIDGTRYPQARLREVLDDGFTRVQPLVILESCGAS